MTHLLATPPRPSLRYFIPDTENLSARVFKVYKQMPLLGKVLCFQVQIVATRLITIPLLPGE
jgi:hypothetical protein